MFIDSPQQKEPDDGKKNSKNYDKNSKSQNEDLPDETVCIFQILKYFLYIRPRLMQLHFAHNKVV